MTKEEREQMINQLLEIKEIGNGTRARLFKKFAQLCIGSMVDLDKSAIGFCAMFECVFKILRDVDTRLKIIETKVRNLPEK